MKPALRCENFILFVLAVSLFFIGCAGPCMAPLPDRRHFRPNRSPVFERSELTARRTTRIGSIAGGFATGGRNITIARE